jgi:hypothetical protein
MGERALGSGNCATAARPHVHKFCYMRVFPNVVLVPPFHGLSPNHPRPTYTRQCRMPTKSQTMGCKGNVLWKLPNSSNAPHVHRLWCMRVLPNML